ncbi:MAG: hypothetical protein KAI83_07215 [Thiomargarita sp.]|nr:hypothetical protein [Thiomargarita sp.]
MVEYLLRKKALRLKLNALKLKLNEPILLNNALKSRLKRAKKNKAIETARTMLADGLDAAVVMKYTGLSPDDLATL